MLYNDYQKQIEQYIRMLATNNDNFLVVISPPGYGKTTMILKAMEQYPKAFKYVNGYITPMEFYLTLWQTTKLAPPKFLILDDVEYSLGEKKNSNPVKRGNGYSTKWAKNNSLYQQ